MAPQTSSLGQIVAHRGWSTAREALLASVQAGPGIVALLGPAGTGKTLLLHEIARTLRASRSDVLLVDRGDTALDEEMLQGVVLIDEADRLAPDSLAGLAHREDLSVVLAALPAFADRLARLPSATVVPLGPIDEDEVPRFVKERLVQLGHSPDLLTLSAITALFERSGSIPRLLHTLLGLAVFAASLEGAERVRPEDVARAVQFRDGEEATAESPAADVPQPAPDVAPMSLVAAMPLVAGALPVRRRRWLTAALVVSLLCLGAGTVLYQRGTADPAVPLPPGPVTAAADAGPASPAADAGPAIPAANGPGPIDPEPETPAAPAPAAAPLLPPGSLIRVVLSYPMGDADAAQRGADLARELRAEGVTTGDPVPVASRTAAPGLLYYFNQDRDGAAALGRRLNGRFGEATLVRLPPRSALPRPGTIELLLPTSDP